MTISKQLTILKENWLIIALVAIAALMIAGGMNIFSSSISSISMPESYAGAYYEQSMQKGVAYDRQSIYPIYPPSYGNSDFAPEVKDRKIAKTASMSTEVQRGSFAEAESKINNIVESSDSFLLNQNSNSNGVGLGRYRYGTYTIKVESGKYDSVISQLKDVGEVKSFNENAEDITGQITNLEDEIKLVKDKLKRYQAILDSATIVSDKTNLIAQITSEERTLKYLEDALQNSGLRVSYSTITVSLTEKQSGYANIGLIKLSALARTLVNSLNTLFNFAAGLLPWVVLAVVGRLIWKRFGKKRVAGRK